MYFPYLYGRGSEILALRSILKDHRPLANFVPVIEPVVADPARLVRCIEEYGKKKQAAIVLLNPDKHDLKGPTAIKAWGKDVLAAIKATTSVLPGWRCTSGVTKADVDGFIAHFAGRQVALAYQSPSLSDAEIAALAAVADIRFHLVVEGKLSAAKQAALPQNKRADIQDRFNKLARNADYKGQEFFSDRHSTFKKDKWAGFGDFLCLGSEFAPGGGPPAAIALHTCFMKTATEMWVEHFVSDDTDIAVGTTASKYLQAAKKPVKAAKARPSEFGSNYALDEFATNNAAHHFPGLPKSKELQLGHHLCVTLDVVNGVL
jgi:hypothetical protein